MQEYVNLVGSAKVKDSREPINKNFSTVASDFSGESFPTENLIENMTCYRTDLNKTYRYNNGSWVVDGVVSVNGQSPTPSTGNIVLDDYVVSVTADGKTLSIKKKDGTESTINISYNLATQVVDGLMSAIDKKKLDEVESTYLPLSGGAMTGQTICRNVHNDALIVAGGNQYTADKGALAIFKGADNDGYFYLRANNGITNKYFVGTPQGSLTWDDHEVAVVDGSIAHAERLNVPRVEADISYGCELNSMRVMEHGPNSANLPSKDWYQVTKTRGSDGSYYQLTASALGANRMFHSVIAGGAWSNWKEMLLAEGYSPAQNGYIKLSNGLILQWGTVGVNDQNTPIYFPVSVSATLAVVPCFEHPSQTSFFRMVAHDNYGFTFKSAYGGTVHWIAICV